MGIAVVAGAVWYFTNPRDDAYDTLAPPQPPRVAVSPVEVLGVSEDLPHTAETLQREAVQACDRLIADLPKAPPALAVKALTFMRLGQTSVAVDCWRQALLQNARFAPAHVGLGTIAFERGDYPVASEYLRGALAIDPLLETAHSHLVQTLLHAGNVQQAASAADEFVRQFPDSAASHYWLGQTYLEASDFEKARQCHEWAVQLAPQDGRAYYSLAVACSRLGETEQAAAYREKFTEFNQHTMDQERRQIREHQDLPYVQELTAGVYRSAGDVYAAAGDALKAEACWLRGAAIASHELPCREALTSFYLQSSRWDEAGQIAEKMIALEPTKADYRAYAGSAYAKLRKWDAARRAFRSALEHDPRSSEARLGLVAIHLESGQPVADVMELAETAVTLAPSPRAYLMLSAVCESRGDGPGALRAMRKALEMDPGNPQLQQAYDHLLETSR